MKLLLVNESGEQVACVPDVERYRAQDAGSVFAMLDLLESLIATANEEPSAGKLLARGSAAEVPA